ncbi:MAG: hypothetical protein M9962_01950 [Oligoflexia bacterium]|nr:hypothetical protein [Oligoflexia bacterium]
MKTQYALFKRKLSNPIHYGSSIVKYREGILLKRKIDDRNFYSECSPLETHSIESITDVQNILKSKNREEIINCQKTPSLSFAISYLDNIYRLTNKLVLPLKINAVFFLEDLKKIKESSESDYTVIKLKISDQNILEIIEIIKNKPEIKFRLDANKNLSESNFEFLLNSIKNFKIKNIEYLEEPFSNSTKSILAINNLLPIAFDESLSDKNFLEDNFKKISHFVIKPSLFGTIESTNLFVKNALNVNKKVIFSSALNSEVGILNLMHLSATYLPTETHGLSVNHLDSPAFNNSSSWSRLPIIESPLDWMKDLVWKDLF